MLNLFLDFLPFLTLGFDVTSIFEFFLSLTKGYHFLIVFSLLNFYLFGVLNETILLDMFFFVENYLHETFMLEMIYWRGLFKSNHHASNDFWRKLFK